MELKHIEYFIEAGRHKSFSQAAEKLYISQQALSSSIRQLEEELGCRLFTRSSAGSVLTPEGEYLAERFAPLVRRFRRLESETKQFLARQRRTLSLASGPLLFGVLDTNALFTYRQENPQIDLDINEMPDSDIERYIQEDSSRFALIAAPETYLRNHFEYRTVQTYPILLCVNKDNPLSARGSVSFGDLREERFLGMGRKSLYHAATREKAAEYGFTPQIVFESSDVNQLCNLVNSNKGIVVGTSSPSFGVLYPNIRTVPFDEPDMQVCIAFIFQSYSKLDADAKAFIDFIVASAAAPHPTD